MDIVLGQAEEDQAIALVSAGFSRPVSPELIADTRLHLPADMSVVALDDGRTVAFASFDLYADGDLIYLKGMMIHPDYQALGLAGQMHQACLAKTEARFYSLRTQSPRMWSAGAKLCDPWLPRLNGADEQELLEMAHYLEEYGTYPHVRGVYQGAIYGQKPTHHDPAIQAWWDEQCDFHAGDAIICIGRLKDSRE